MASTLVKTRTPGVYRRGERYAYTWRDRLNKQRWGSARTLEIARAKKAEEEAKVRRGQDGQLARDGLLAYLREWVERYQGTGRRGFREETRDDYKAVIETYYARFFDSGFKLGELDPRTVAEL